MKTDEWICCALLRAHVIDFERVGSRTNGHVAEFIRKIPMTMVEFLLRVLRPMLFFNKI